MKWLPQNNPILDLGNNTPHQSSRKSMRITLVALTVILIVTILIYGLSLLISIPNLFSVFKDDGIRTTNAVTAIEEQYGLRLAFPDGWMVDDCSPETTRYLGETIRYICRFVSPAHPDSNLTTTIYLFVFDKDIQLIDTDLDKFVRERQIVGWGGEMERNSSLSVTFDRKFDTVYYYNQTGLRSEDIVFNTVLGGWDLWTSTVLPVPTPVATLLLEVTHPNDTVSGRSVYDISDVLQYITIHN